MSKKIWITTGVVAALAAAYTAGGFWGVPSGIQWAIKKYAEPFTDRKITLDEVKFNPFTLQLTASGLRIQKEGEPQAFMAAEVPRHKAQLEIARQILPDCGSCHTRWF